MGVQASAAIVDRREGVTPRQRIARISLRAPGNTGRRIAQKYPSSICKVIDPTSSSICQTPRALRMWKSWNNVSSTYHRCALFNELPLTPERSVDPIFGLSKKNKIFFDS
jgi:hypothetical protein